MVVNDVRRPDVLLTHFFGEVEALEQAEVGDDAFDQRWQIGIVKVCLFEIQNSKFRTFFDELFQVRHRSAKTVVADVEFGQCRRENLRIFGQKSNVVIGESTPTQAEVLEFVRNVLENVRKLIVDDAVGQIETPQL